MSSEGFHEDVDLLSEQTRDLHRAIVSLMEELEAVDWYTQRAEACSSPGLQEILIHNRNEEIEHAMMTLEWIRRNSHEFDTQARKFLFAEESPVDLEHEDEEADASNSGSREDSLNIGSLRAATEEE